LSFIGAASIIFPIPYTVVLLTISTLGKFNPLLLAAVAGLGSAVGEFVGYGLGYVGRGFVGKKRERRLNAMLRLFDRFGAVAVFFFALTPLPDDLLFIPLGLLRYKFWKAFLPCVAGKFFMLLIIAYVGEVIGRWYVESPIFAVTTMILLVLVGIAMLRIDWEKVEKTLMKRGGKLKKDVGRFAELGIILFVYAAITLLAFRTAMKVEWAWRAIQLLLPIAALLISQRQPKSLGLTFKGIFRGMELGVLVGVLLAICLTPFYMTLIPPKMGGPLTFFSFGSAVVLIVSNVIAMEIFYRGYMQTQLEMTIGRAQGLIATSLLCGLDFWEFKILNPLTVVIAASVFGFLYQRRRTLAAPIAAHMVFLLLIEVLFAS
jgi:membrane protein YqaA with SNARE-associated domain/membrane protease YdiL (CAAX protease family)